MTSGRLARVLFWAAAAFAFVMAVLPHPPELPGEPNDKVQHMLAFATLAVLATRAYRRTSLWQIIIGLSAFGALIEIVQGIDALHRDSDVLDWVADTLACSIVLLAAAGFQRWRHDAAHGRLVASDGSSSYLPRQENKGTVNDQL